MITRTSRTFIIALSILVILIAATTARAMLQKDVPPEILQDPDPRLHTRSEEITLFNEETVKIAEELRAIIKKVDGPHKIFGLGMAAPQIGHHKRMVALKNSYDDYLIMVNPESVEERWQLPSPSSCFSLKGTHFLQRPFWMKVKYQDLDGNPQEMTLRGPRAATMKQEIDHLDGVLLTDY